jgi:peptidoglycan-associated lipoprotein
MMLTRRIAVLTIATLSVAAAACRKKPEPAPLPAAQPTATAPRGPDPDSIARVRAEEARLRRIKDSTDAANAARDAAARDAASLRATLTATVHFAYDQSDLRPDDKSILDAKIPILQANTGVMIRVSGHTDERGSDEYNLALGQRRAAAAKAYLVQHGIAESRIETISYGEERPSAQGSDESAYSQNRRAEFEITAGGQSLRKP